MVLESHLGVPCGLDLKSQSLVIESFSVGSRAVLSTMGEGFGGSRFKVLYGPSFWVTKETCVEESIAGSGTRAEPLEAAVQSNGKDNLLTSTVAPVVVPDSLPPRHQTYLPCFHATC